MSKDALDASRTAGVDVDPVIADRNRLAED